MIPLREQEKGLGAPWTGGWRGLKTDLSLGRAEKVRLEWRCYAAVANFRISESFPPLICPTAMANITTMASPIRISIFCFPGIQSPDLKQFTGSRLDFPIPHRTKFPDINE